MLMHITENCPVYIPLPEMLTVLDVPNELLTLHEYSPGRRLIESSIFSTFLYVEVALSVIDCVSL